MEAKKTYSLSIYLHKKEIDNFKDCLVEVPDDSNSIENFDEYDISQEKIGTTGKLYISYSNPSFPNWETDINKFVSDTTEIKLGESRTNRAVIVLKVKGRFMSLVFGHGRYLLNDATIERDFGLKVAANIIHPERIRSLNSLNIEDTVLNIQRQSSAYSNHNQLQVDTSRDILKEVAGAPSRRMGDSAPKFIAGTDYLKASKKMKLTDILQELEAYLDQYKRKDYRNNQFRWLDNVQRVKDKEIENNLDFMLIEAIKNNDSEVNIGPNSQIDWSNLDGFFLNGLNETNKYENYRVEIPTELYFDDVRDKFNRNGINILSKLNNNYLFAAFYSGEELLKIDSIYNSINFECNYNSNRYLLTHGEWFRIDVDYYEDIKSKIEQIEVENNIEFIDYDDNNSIKHIEDGVEPSYGEGHYNIDLADSHPTYHLLDEANFMIPGFAHSKIEPCDVITENKELIHIKRYNGSSSLSHLLAQGLVSAQQLAREDFRNHINEKVGREIIDSHAKVSDFKVVYAIVHKDTNKSVHEILPFFTMVNLTLTVERLRQMDISYSIAKIDIV